MTTDEHLLVATMLTKMFQYMSVFSEILRSRGVIEKDDFAAFSQFSFQQTERWPKFLAAVLQEYSQTANRLNLEKVAQEIQEIADNLPKT